MPGSSSRRHSHTPDAGAALALGATRDRRHSTSSDSAGGLSDGGVATGVRQFSNENIEYLPARLAKVTTSKPAANPLQFVKVGPCDLYRSAQEQIRRVEQVKKMKAEVREEAEDWQSNLDNWKSSRRKRQEHIIERVVEVKKLEQMEECDRNRRKSKTFSEILEERRGRKLSLPMYQEEDALDLSELGISGSGSTTARRSYDFGDDDASSQNGHASPTPSTDGGASVASSEPPQEYTFEGAIQGYVDFAETRVRNGHASKSPGATPLAKRAPPPPAKPRRDSAPEPGAPRPPAPTLPNVDVGKRRELFEKAAGKAAPSSRPSRMPAAAASVRERLSSLERQASANGEATTNGSSNGTPNGSVNGSANGSVNGSVNGSANGSANVSANVSANGTPNGSPKRMSSRERLANISPIKEAPFQNKLASLDSEEPPRPPRPTQKKPEVVRVEEKKANGAEAEPGEPRRQRQLHRSLDSLDVVPAGDLLSEAFERVQSLQALDCCGRGPGGPLAVAAGGSSSELLAASSQSGDTDREDSGIHTADVSCSVSQADEPVCDEPVCDEPVSVSEETATTVGSEVPPCPSPCPLLSPLSRDDDPSPALSPAPPATPEKLPQALPQPLMPEPLIPELVPLSLPLPQQELQAAVEEVAEKADSVPEAQDGEEMYVQDLITIEKPVVEAKTPEPVAAVPPQPEKALPEEKEEEKTPILTPVSPAAPAPLTLPPLAPLSLVGEVEIVGGGLTGFPLGPTSSAEPPKEKPPPPPADLSADEEDAPPAESPLRRLDSTKRIKKEIRRKRSDFLGIDGGRDDDALEAALALAAPPPDMAALLAEERRLQQQLFRRSLASDATDATDASTTAGDANDAAESRDSGVELERAVDGVDDADAASPEPPRAGDALRRRDELFGHTSLTSEEEEVSRQEREIIANLEQEEQWRRNDNSIGEQLAERLRVLELEKAEMERRRIEEEGIRREEERRLAAREAAIRMHEELEEGKSLLQDGDKSEGEHGSESISFQNSEDNPDPQPSLEDSANTGEALRREQARLEAQREQLREYEPPLLPSPIQQAPPPQHRWSVGPGLPAYGCRQPEMSPPHGSPQRRPPPPAPPAKPQRMPSLEQQERVNSIRSSRVPSADCLAPPPALIQQQIQQQQQQQSPQHPHQMSRQTLQALSAAPRSRLITNDTWMQARRKQEPPNARPTLNTQHWLIQEAEHRRLTEQAQRCAPPPRRPPPPVQQQSPPWATQQPPPPPPPPRPESKPLPDSIIQTLTQRVQGRAALNDKRKAAGNGLSPIREPPPASLKQYASTTPTPNLPPPALNGDSQERMLSVSGKKKCSHCGEELGRGAAMIIESLRLFYHIDCFKCCVCHVQLGDGLMGTDVRVRNSKLHCHNCYSSEDDFICSCSGYLQH